MKQFLTLFKKIFTHNYCDTCGFTKNEIYLTVSFMESGLIQCQKCYNKQNKQIR